MPTEIFVLAILIIVFVTSPAIFLHYLTQWRKQKALQPEDERMMEDLWHAAKRMERRIETLEALIEAGPEDDTQGRPPRRPDHRSKN